MGLLGRKACFQLVLVFHFFSGWQFGENPTVFVSSQQTAVFREQESGRNEKSEKMWILAKYSIQSRFQSLKRPSQPLALVSKKGKK